MISASESGSNWERQPMRGKPNIATLDQLENEKPDEFRSIKILISFPSANDRVASHRKATEQQSFSVQLWTEILM